MFKFYKLILIFIFFLILNFLYADNGENGAIFLKMYSDAETAGLANIGVVNKAGNISLEQNPATIYYLFNSGKLKNKSLKMSYNEFIGNINGGYLQYAQNIGLFYVGSYFKYIKVRDIIGTDQYGNDTGLFSSQYNVFALVFGYTFGQYNVALTTKRLDQSIYTTSANSMAYDLGLIYTVNEKIDIGVSALNIGEPVVIDGNKNSLPFTYNLGVSYLINSQLVGALAIEKEVDNYTESKLGLEWQPYDLIKLRAGYRVLGATQLDSGLSFGMSFIYQNLKIDYAYLPFDQVSTTHKISMSFLFAKD